MEVIVNDFQACLKPIDLDRVAQIEEAETGSDVARRYLVRKVEPRFDEAYSFVVTNRKSEDTYDVDLLALPEGYTGRCTCRGYVLGGSTCIHIRKALIFHVAINLRERRLYVAPVIEIPYSYFLELVQVVDGDDARRLFDEYMAGDLPLVIPQEGVSYATAS